MEIDWKNPKQVEIIIFNLNKDKNLMENLENNIKLNGIIDQQIKTYIEMMNKKKEEDKAKLEELKNCYGNNIERIIQMIKEKNINI